MPDPLLGGDGRQGTTALRVTDYESTREKYDQLLRIAQKYSDPWNDFDATVSELAAYIDRHGDTPTLDGAVWTDDDGRRHYVGDNPDVYLTLARLRVGEKA